MRALTTLLLLLQLGASAAAEEVRLRVDGHDRTYLLERPPTKVPAPTIVALHGAYGSAKGMAQLTDLTRLGPRSGFVTVFPQSQAEVWNRFLPGQESPAARELFRRFDRPPADIAFLRQIVADLVRQGISDPARVFLVGFSNGGFMTLAMYCTEPQLFAGFGLIASSMPEMMGETCNPAQQRPVVVVNGTADTVVPYDGGYVARLREGDPHAFRVWSTDRLESFLQRRSDCKGTPLRERAPGRGGGAVETTRSRQCAGGAIDVHRVVGATHGTVASAVSTGQIVVDFFRASTRTHAEKIKSHLKYVRFDGATRVEGDFRRTAGDQWLETNTRGSRWTFRTVSEKPSEIVLHDVSRDVYVKFDTSARKVQVRKGPAAPWAPLADIVATDN